MNPDGRLQLDSYLPYRLSVASNAVSGLIARAYEDRFGLSIPQWRLVCVLAEDGGLSQAGLCELMRGMNGTGSGTLKFGIGRVQINPRSMRITANSEFRSA